MKASDDDNELTNVDILKMGITEDMVREDILSWNIYKRSPIPLSREREQYVVDNLLDYVSPHNHDHFIPFSSFSDDAEMITVNDDVISMYPEVTTTNAEV